MASHTHTRAEIKPADADKPKIKSCAVNELKRDGRERLVEPGADENGSCVLGFRV